MAEADLSQATKSTNVRPNTALAWVRGAFGVAGRVTPGLATRAAERLFFTPRRYALPQRERLWRAEARERRVYAGGALTVVYTWGEGPPVLLVHGWEGRGTQMGGLATALAASGYQAIAFDAPAHGDSSGSRAHMARFIDVVRALNMEVGEFEAVVGHSIGGAVTVVALSQGVRARRAVVISAPSRLGHVLRSFSETAGLSENVEGRLRARIESRFGHDVWERFSPLSHVGALGLPALIIHDIDDEEVPPSDGVALAKAWPRARMHATEGLGHRRILRDDEVTGAVVDFVRDGGEPNASKA